MPALTVVALDDALKLLGYKDALDQLSYVPREDFHKHEEKLLQLCGDARWGRGQQSTEAITVIGTLRSELLKTYSINLMVDHKKQSKKRLVRYRLKVPNTIYAPTPNADQVVVQSGLAPAPFSVPSAISGE